MKLGLVITGLLTMLMAAPVTATTLKLSSDIELLVLDGRKISGSLLKGAEGLELERGQHQVLFRVEKNLLNKHQLASPWLSTPLVATFTARVQAITITLPALNTMQQGHAFNKHPEFQLYDEQGNKIESLQDRLTTTSENYEQAMIAFNLQGKAASVPRFAQPHTSANPTSISDSAVAQRNSPGTRVLQLWYQQVDSATRQRFVLLMRALHTS
ncbi:DUF2057 family protein [Pantoea sp. CCBC3-3-1]|uniref:YccT family protein n=1 Tax=Pantoea sp. CCBC3-3-1 TaxID=2490851 RepID=UPI0011BF3E77|nr:DUF2057 family protein [Pantoea sp. CCBC3-3-1]